MDYCRFNHIYEDILYNITPFLKTEKVEKGQYLFRYGDLSAAFYVLLKGKISIRVPKKNKNKRNEKNNNNNNNPPNNVDISSTFITNVKTKKKEKKPNDNSINNISNDNANKIAEDDNTKQNFIINEMAKKLSRFIFHLTAYDISFLIIN